MQAALHHAPPPFPVATPTKAFVLPQKSIISMRTSKCSAIKASPPAASESSTADYSSTTSVFPAEACDTVGGEACDVQMYPEAKIKPEASGSSATTSSEHVDREYLEYSGPKTVFIEEACDDLGGEFCEPEFLKQA